MGRSKRLGTAATAFCLIGMIGVELTRGQDEPKPKPKIKIVSAVENNAQREKIEADLRSTDQAKVDAAVAVVRKAVLTRGKGNPGDLNILIAAGFASEAEAICVRGIIENPANSAMVARFARVRVSCLEAKKDYPAALSAAKAYYNVCWSNMLPHAVRVFSQCLAEAFPNDPDLPARFERQQLAGAFVNSGPTTGPSHESATPDNLGLLVLASIKIDPEPYREAIEQLTANDYVSLISKANLLLLSDKADDAMDFLDEAIAVAPPTKLQGTHQHMARAIRAKNGRTGEADAYLSKHLTTPTP